MNPLRSWRRLLRTDYNSVVGPINWSGKPVKNVSKTPLVAGQWRKTEKGFELVICENSTAPSIPAQDNARELLGYVESRGISQERP